MINKFDNLLDAMDGIPNINKGGCGAFALMVAEHLRQLYTTKIPVYNYDRKNINVIRTASNNSLSFRDWSHNGMKLAHIVVEFEYNKETYTIDSSNILKGKSITDDGELIRSDGELLIEELRSFVNNASIWNPTFNRMFIPVMKSRIDNFFKNELSLFQS
ncbi:MAG: hypothetical protein ACXW0J_02780 [Nitrososphaeraceae archaeon]